MVLVWIEAFASASLWSQDACGKSSLKTYWFLVHDSVMGLTPVFWWSFEILFVVQWKVIQNRILVWCNTKVILLWCRGCILWKLEFSRSLGALIMHVLIHLVIHSFLELFFFFEDGLIWFSILFLLRLCLLLFRSAMDWCSVVDLLSKLQSSFLKIHCWKYWFVKHLMLLLLPPRRSYVRNLYFASPTSSFFLVRFQLSMKDMFMVVHNSLHKVFVPYPFWILKVLGFGIDEYLEVVKVLPSPTLGRISAAAYICFWYGNSQVEWVTWFGSIDLFLGNFVVLKF